MKKIIAIMLMMVLLFTACGDKEIAKTDEELRAEVAAEMEAEAKLKEELKEELKKEIEEELRKEAVEEVVEEVKKADAYYIEDLKLGQSIAGCTVKDIEYIPENSAFLLMKGEKTLKGTIIFDEMYDAYSFVSEDKIFDKALIIDGVEVYGVTSFATTTFNQDALEWLELSAYTFLEENKKLPVEITMNHYSVSTKYESSANENIHITKMIPTEITSDDATTPVLEGALTQFDNESIMSNYESVYLDFSKYHLVILPSQPTGNAYKLKSRNVVIHEDTTEDNSTKFAIMGKVMNLKLTYDANALDERDKEIIVNVDGPIEDEIISIYAKWPTDTSSILVEGNYMYQSAIENFQFSIDSVRDPEAYEILIFEAKENNSPY